MPVEDPGGTTTPVDDPGGRTAPVEPGAEGLFDARWEDPTDTPVVPCWPPVAWDATAMELEPALLLLPLLLATIDWLPGAFDETKEPGATEPPVVAIKLEPPAPVLTRAGVFTELRMLLPCATDWLVVVLVEELLPRRLTHKLADGTYVSMVDIAKRAGKELLT